MQILKVVVTKPNNGTVSVQVLGKLTDGRFFTAVDENIPLDAVGDTIQHLASEADELLSVKAVATTKVAAKPE